MKIRDGMTGGTGDAEPQRTATDDIFGIVIAGGRRTASGSVDKPRISAFIWGGKTRPVPTLPFGRWRGAA